VPFPAERGEVSVRLSVGKRVRLADIVAATTLAEGPVTWEIDPPLRPYATGVVLEVETPAEGPFLFLTSASLAEVGRP
jgi:hypothetical protein